MSPNPDYVDRVNRAIDYILGHLSERPSLDEIAAAACLSSFHFHRIFRAVLGETVGQFTKRVRLERALTMMSRPGPSSLAEVASACGFSTASDFSRAFKQRHGVPPSAFDVQTFRRGRRDAMNEELCGDAPHRLARLPPGQNPDGFTVSIESVPARTVAYIRVLQPYEGTGVQDAAQRLVDWADARGLADGQWLGYQWDDPEIVALADCRYDIGVVVPRATARDGEVGILQLPAMRVAELPIAGPIELAQRALDWLFGTWLPNSAWVPDDQPCFEAFEGLPYADGTSFFRERIQLPVRAPQRPSGAS